MSLFSEAHDKGSLLASRSELEYVDKFIKSLNSRKNILRGRIKELEIRTKEENKVNEM